MSLGAVVNPFQPILGLNGQGVNNGDLYIGEDGRDPQTYPQACYWDAAGTIQATQPIDIQGGYPMRLGSPAQVFTADTYSIRVRDRRGAQVFYVAHAVPAPTTRDGIFENMAEAVAAVIPAAVREVGVQLLGYYTALDGGGASWKYSAAMPAHQARFQSTDGAWWELTGDAVNVRALGAKGDGSTSDVTAINNATTAAVYLEKAVYFPPGSYAVATGLSITHPGTRWIADEGSESSRWYTNRSLVEILYTGTSTTEDIVTVGGIIGNGFQHGAHYDIERVTIANINIRAATAGKGRDGLRIDGGNDVAPSRGFARDIELQNVTVENVGSVGINVRGWVFDVRMWAPAVTGNRGSGFRCGSATSVAGGGLNRPGEIWLYEAYSCPDTDVAAYGLLWSYEFATGYSFMFGGKGQGSKGIYAGPNTALRDVELEEAANVKYAGSIGLHIAGLVTGSLSLIANYETCVTVGDGANVAEGYAVRVGQLKVATTGVNYTAGATRTGFVSLGLLTTVTTPVVDSRTASLIPFETIYETIWSDGAYDFTAPNILLARRYAQPPMPQEVNAGGTITVGSGSTIELTTAEVANFALGATPVSAGKPGEELTIVNRSGYAITFPNNASFSTATGVAQALGQAQAIKIVYSAALGRWMELGSH